MGKIILALCVCFFTFSTFAQSKCPLGEIDSFQPLNLRPNILESFAPFETIRSKLIQPRYTEEAYENGISAFSLIREPWMRFVAIAQSKIAENHRLIHAMRIEKQAAGRQRPRNQEAVDRIDNEIARLEANISQINSRINTPIAIFDSGVSPVVGRAESFNIVEYHDLVEGQEKPKDTISHGTGMASIIGAESNGFGMTGALPGVPLVIFRGVDDDEKAPLERLEKALELAKKAGVKVFSMSFGANEREWPTLAFRRVLQRFPGILVVASAGNNGINVNQTRGENRLIPSTLEAPNLFIVGNASSVGVRDRFSNFGRQVLGYYKGVRIPQWRYIRGDNWGLTDQDGTSHSTPLIASIAHLATLMSPWGPSGFGPAGIVSLLMTNRIYVYEKPNGEGRALGYYGPFDQPNDAASAPYVNPQSLFDKLFEELNI